VPTSFADLDLLPSLQGTLVAAELTTLTPIQAAALPDLLQRRSVVAIAETGSGKTLTYVLPILDRLKRMEDDGNRVELEGEPRAVVVVPTRELGEQVAKVFKTFTHDTRLRVRTVLGGQKSTHNRENVSGAFEVLVATPGRLEALLESKLLSFDAIRVIVLDEADQLLDEGFVEPVLAVLRRLPSLRQLMMFSATMSEEVERLVTRLFSDARIVRTEAQGKVVEALITRHVDVPDGDRLEALRPLLTGRPTGGTMLFANTREQCDRLEAWLQGSGLRCAVLRGNMDHVERRRNLAAFRAGELDLLIATDMGSRGLDIGHVDRVINVHLPHDLDNYLHRAGRTARAGRGGEVINLVTPRDAPLMMALGDGARAPEFVRRPRPSATARPRRPSGPPYGRR
jgi:ATP-dependent RNA helicase RhlE